MSEEAIDIITDLHAKIQYLIDSWPGDLPDGGITFPDGDFWPVSDKKEPKNA